jgi:peptidylprolyl isomerase
MRWMLAAVCLASLLAAAGAAQAAKAKARHKPAHATPAAADWRELDPEDALLIETNKGRIIVEMVPEAAPKHVTQIKKLARSGVYDGNQFFRVIDWFMAQTGDPKNTGEGGSSEPNLKAEFTFRRGPETRFTVVATPMGAEQGFVRSLPVVSQAASFMELTGDRKVAAWGTYCPGVAGMARDDDPDSANSQFFLMRRAYPSLDKRYTAWGRVVSGLEVVRAIKTGEPVIDPDRMTRVRVLADVPAAERPRIRLPDPRGPTFKRSVAAARLSKGPDFSVCDVELPVELRPPVSG